MISPPARNFLNSSFVNVESLRAIEGEPHLDIHPRRRRRARHRARRRGRASSTTAAACSPVPVDGPRAPAGLVVGLWIWWKKLGSDGQNANELTSQRLTDLGRAPVFYDCLVEVERARRRSLTARSASAARAISPLATVR